MRNDRKHTQYGSQPYMCLHTYMNIICTEYSACACDFSLIFINSWWWFGICIQTGGFCTGLLTHANCGARHGRKCNAYGSCAW